MKKKEHSAKFLRKRKFMMVLPLLIIPFLTMAFWAMGGGKGKEDGKTRNAGLNANLPDANLKVGEGFDKLSFYQTAEQDSAKLKEAMKADPYYRNQLDQVAYDAGYSGLNNPTGYSNVNDRTAKVYEKIAEINHQLNQPVVTKSSPVTTTSADMDRLEQMMQMMSNSEEDPEINQLNTTLDKILDVQHPARVREKIKEQSLKNNSRVYVVSSSNAALDETIIKRDSAPHRPGNRFYSEASKPLAQMEGNSAITAVIHETQTLVAGSTVKLRLTGDVYINGMLIPSGTFVFGTASLENERLLITIASINYRNHLLPVSLSVHDIDGVAGVYIPGSINRDIAKQSADQSLGSVELVSMDPSLSAQATAAGIGAAKTLLSKKVKLLKVTVKAGYRVLLKDKNQQNY
jgi:conjugative transposon TraM protein